MILSQRPPDGGAEGSGKAHLARPWVDGGGFAEEWEEEESYCKQAGAGAAREFKV